MDLRGCSLKAAIPVPDWVEILRANDIP